VSPPHNEVFVKAVVVFFAVLLVACETSPPGRIRVLITANSDVRDIPLAMAAEDLRGQGYQVDVTPMMSGALMVDALARGEAELGSFNNETLWAAVAKGLRARTVVQRLSFPNLIVASANVTDCRVLNGRPVALGSQVGLNPRLVTRYVEARCPGAVPQVLVIPDSAARTTALVAGRVDAALLPVEELLKLQSAAPGRYAALVDLTKEFPQLQVNAVQARVDWLDERPKAARDFIRALLVVHRRIMASPEMLSTRAIEQLKMDPIAAKALINALIASGAWDPNGALTRDNVHFTLTFLQESDAVPKHLRVDDVADFAPLNEVLAEIGRK
jgi:NMT1/THI5 like protein